MYDTDSIIRAVKNAVNEYTGFGGSEMTLELALHLTEEVKKEAARLGFKQILCPKKNEKKLTVKTDAALCGVSTLYDTLKLLNRQNKE